MFALHFVGHSVTLEGRHAGMYRLLSALLIHIKCVLSMLEPSKCLTI